MERLKIGSIKITGKSLKVLKLFKEMRELKIIINGDGVKFQAGGLNIISSFLLSKKSFDNFTQPPKILVAIIADFDKDLIFNSIESNKKITRFKFEFYKEKIFFHIKTNEI